MLSFTRKYPGFAGGEVVKNLPASEGAAGDQARFDPWVRKIPWRRKWQPTPYSRLGNPMDREAWQATARGGHRVGWTRPSTHAYTLTQHQHQVLEMLCFPSGRVMFPWFIRHRAIYLWSLRCSQGPGSTCMIHVRPFYFMFPPLTELSTPASMFSWTFYYIIVFVDCKL